MGDIRDLKILILFILTADLLGCVIYGAKGNIVGAFNCVSWAIVAGFILMNLKKIFNIK